MECLCLCRRLDGPQRQTERGGEEKNLSQSRAVLKSELCWSIRYCLVRENSFLQHRGLISAMELNAIVTMHNFTKRHSARLPLYMSG